MKKTIGYKIKELRLLQDMTLKQLSQKTAISISHLSQVERNISSLSFEALQKIADIFSVNISYFMDANTSQGDFIKRNYDYTPTQFKNSSLIYNIIGTEHPECILKPTLATIMPHTSSIINFPNHNDGEDFIFVLEGILNITIDDKEYILSPADSIHFNTSPHQLINKSDRIVRILIVHSSTTE